VKEVEARDWFVMLLLGGVLVASTVYIFKHPDDINFGAWCTFVGTVGGIYHWLVLIDSKRPDADRKRDSDGRTP
jgi:hypothetical protein